ncbi:ABC transporter ATP-binding protein [Rothia nasisuis]|uniref:ABC transporter ATP-binding protein n=1 Tax=Rothia nasisuis TaxID=2109647 RepID=UPI001F21D4E6|nr:ABC transporter ATP-binding protein [Rothia nasisuis]
MKAKNSLTLSELRYSFPQRTLWENLSIKAESGHFIAIRGHSGSGKTTLLQCIGSLERPSAGTIDFNGINPSTLKGKAKRDFLRNTVSLAFQNSGLVASWSVRKNLDLAGYKVNQDQPRAEATFNRFNLDYSFLDKPVYQLSGGEQQRVSLIRLALRNTPLVLLDEPTAALDDDNAQRVLNFIQDHCNQGGIAVVATHDARLLGYAHDSINLG